MSNITVHTGFWINHSFNPVQGATLTLPMRWGNYLIAALSSLVAAAGVGVWKLCAFYLHQHIASMKSREVLEQQLQVLLRNSASAFDVLVDSIELDIAWKGRAKKVKRRTWLAGSCALVVLLASIAAGIFVADVASKSYQTVLVLAEPRDCGDLDFVMDPDAPDGVQLAMYDAQIQYIMKKASSMRRYATYYYSNMSGYSGGSYFPSPQLPFEGLPVACPFDHDGRTRCLGPNMTDGPAWQMDTGLLSSHAHFGVNAAPEDRIALRKRVTCAVVDPRNFSSKPVPVESEVAGRKINNTYIILGGKQDGTLSELLDNSDISLSFNLDVVLPGGMTMANRVVWDAQEEDIEIPRIADAFNRTDADVAIWMITQSTKTMFSKPVWDPMFLANVSQKDPRYGIRGMSYRAGIPFSLAVCMDSWQLCNPSNDRCTDMAGSHKLAKGRILDVNLGLNDAQKATALRFARINLLAGQFSDGSANGPTGLLASEMGGGREASYLPPDQWIREVELWFGTMLATLQDATLDWVSKPWADAGAPPDAYQTRQDPATKYAGAGLPAARWDDLCRGQLFRPSVPMQNFSVLGLGLVVGLSVVAVVAGACLPWCVGLARARKARRGRLGGRAGMGQLARLADDKYHLLRLALGKAGVEGWELGWNDIPVSADRNLLAPVVLGSDGLTQFGWHEADDRVERSMTIETETIAIEKKDEGNA